MGETRSNWSFAFPSPAEAVAAACAALTPTGTERVTPDDARGRVLAEPIRADRDSPPLDVSAMDGFAVRMEDVEAMAAPTGLGIAEECARIGCKPIDMPPSPCAVRIVTGAPIPLGAAAVVKREDVVEHAGRIALRPGAKAVSSGLFVRRRGENARAGAEVLGRGTLIGPPAAGVMASFGVSAVQVYRRVRVAIISTGDELVNPGERPEDWRLRDGNGPGLMAMLSAHRWIELRSSVQVRDDQEAISAAVHAATEDSDALILSGGVSMGDRDLVPSAVEAVGGRTIFHGVPQRPGKPMLVAVVERPGRGAMPIVALPGNPVSVMVTGRRIALPILATIAGLGSSMTGGISRSVSGDDGGRIDLWWHRAVVEDGSGGLRLVTTKSSGDLASIAGSAGFVEWPPGEGGNGFWPFFAWES